MHPATVADAGAQHETARPVEKKKNRHTGMKASPQINDRAMRQHEALFRHFGYDSAASLKFILAQALPLPGHVLEIGTGKGRFLAAMTSHAERITTLDMDAAQQRAAKLHVRQTRAGSRIRFIAHDAEHLPWPDAQF
jgi:ubiquinone/menaquinone biosynthesis C-methylase UbiE